MPLSNHVVDIGTVELVEILPPSSIPPATGRTSNNSAGSASSNGSFFIEGSSKSGGGGGIGGGSASGGGGGGGFFDVFVPGKRRADGSMVTSGLHSPPSIPTHSSISSTATSFAVIAGGGNGSSSRGDGGAGAGGRAGAGATGADTAMIRCHGNWNLTSVRTGRLSCCKPNMQNMPNRQVVAGQFVDLVDRNSLTSPNLTSPNLAPPNLTPSKHTIF